MILIVTLLLFIGIASREFQRQSETWEYRSFVEPGKGLSRLIDWRTANVSDCPKYLSENPGFYQCVTNFGPATAVVWDSGRCEVHIHNFRRNIYGRLLKMKDFVRHERVPVKLL